MAGSFKKLYQDDRIQGTFQDNVETSLRQLQNPFLKGRLIENIQMQVGNNEINTGLGHKLNGWVVARLQTTVGAVFWENPTTIEGILNLNLLSINPCVISLWVF